MQLSLALDGGDLKSYKKGWEGGGMQVYSVKLVFSEAGSFSVQSNQAVV